MYFQPPIMFTVTVSADDCARGVKTLTESRLVCDFGPYGPRAARAKITGQHTM